MRRLLVLWMVMGMLLLSVTPAGALVPAATVGPTLGPPGSAATVFVTGFSPGFQVEVHGESLTGPVLGTGITNASGAANIGITIPAGAPVGPYPIVVCLVSPSIACGASEFSETAFTSFEVTAPPPPPTTSTTTTAATTTTVACAPEWVLDPPDGATPGGEVLITATGFMPGSPIEVRLHEFGLRFGSHEESHAVAPIAFLAADGSGAFSEIVRIPDSARGLYVLSFEDETHCSIGFGPYPIFPIPDPDRACDVPADAIVIDFDAWDRDMGSTVAPGSALSQALHSFYGLVGFQWDRATLTGSGGATDVEYMLPGLSTEAYVADNPAAVSPDLLGGLGTSSPPNALRIIDDGFFSLLPTGSAMFESEGEDLPAGSTVLGVELRGQLDYFGFTVGFGHFGEGMDRPEELVVELRVRVMPLDHLDGSVSPGGEWDSVSVTLGPGPQPVTTCLMAVNTLGPAHDWATYQIDILPREVDGGPLHLPLDIDDVFFGADPPPVFEGCPIPAGADVIDFDDFDPGWSVRDETWAPILTRSGNSFRFGHFDRLVETEPGSWELSPPYRSLDVGIASVLPGTVSPPFVALGEGHLEFTIERAVDYVGLHMGWPESDAAGVLALIDEGGSVRYDIVARHLPVHQLDGAVFAPELARTAIELGPEFSPVSHCVVLDLSAADMHPAGGSVIVEITASYRGEPSDYPPYIDDVFFGDGPVPETTDPTVAPAAADLPDAAAEPPADAGDDESGSGFLLFLALGLGGAALIGGAAWWLLRRRRLRWGR